MAGGEGSYRIALRDLRQTAAENKPFIAVLKRCPALTRCNTDLLTSLLGVAC
jgi:hypothetical protein